MNAADLLVLPSVAEAFGLVLVEAMACGLPVIAVDAHGPAKIVEPETGWLVPPDDETALADALVVSANDLMERQRRGAYARAMSSGTTAGSGSRSGWPRSTSRRSLTTRARGTRADGEGND
jgi:glycosyltransferase involved in cell wall biosynthesis